MTTLESLLSITDFEQQWMANADRAIGQYVAGGAGSDRTVAANVAAFDDVWLAFIGPKLREGASGLGPTPRDALDDFNRHFMEPLVSRNGSEPA